MHCTKSSRPGQKKPSPASERYDDRDMKTRVEISAGGVIYRAGRAGPEVCLIQPEGGENWQLPKGLIERGEETSEAALREVSEETGLFGEVEQQLDRIEYWYVWKEDGEATRVHKWVYFYLMRYKGGDTKDHDHEVNEAVWYPIAEAPKRLTFESEQNIVKLAAEALAAV